MDLYSRHFDKTLVLFLNFVNICSSLGLWTEYKPIPKDLSWDASTTTDIVFRSEHKSMTKCALECNHDDACNLILIYQDHCYGLSNYTETTTASPVLKVYIKQRRACPGDFVFIDGLCLLVSTFKLNWFEAKDYCEKQNGVLITLDIESKHGMFTQILQKFYVDANVHFYVGATDIQQEGTWTWINPDSLNYFDWQKQQPNNQDVQHSGQDANCGVYNSATSKLIDEYCYQTKKFVCEN